MADKSKPSGLAVAIMSKIKSKKEEVAPEEDMGEGIESAASDAWDAIQADDREGFISAIKNLMSMM